MTAEIKAHKRELRATLTAALARVPPQERLARSRQVAARLEGLAPLQAARTVAVYAPLGSEVDAGLAAARLRARGVRVLFPRSVPGERRLVFSACAPEELVRGPLGALEPRPGEPEVRLAEVDAFLLPGLGFSSDGLRLGRGGGYYDMALQQAPRAARIGLCFDLQLVPSLPHEPHDAPLDALVTESRTFLFQRSHPT
jgi:5-formyltetrahydrofolate cyclo-ligase